MLAHSRDLFGIPYHLPQIRVTIPVMEPIRDSNLALRDIFGSVPNVITLGVACEPFWINSETTNCACGNSELASSKNACKLRSTERLQARERLTATLQYRTALPFRFVHSRTASPFHMISYSCLCSFHHSYSCCLTFFSSKYYVGTITYACVSRRGSAHSSRFQLPVRVP